MSSGERESTKGNEGGKEKINIGWRMMRIGGIVIIGMRRV